MIFITETLDIAKRIHEYSLLDIGSFQKSRIPITRNQLRDNVPRSPRYITIQIDALITDNYSSVITNVPRVTIRCHTPVAPTGLNFHSNFLIDDVSGDIFQIPSEGAKGAANRSRITRYYNRTESKDNLKGRGKRKERHKIYTRGDLQEYTRRHAFADMLAVRIAIK